MEISIQNYHRAVFNNQNAMFKSIKNAPKPSCIDTLHRENFLPKIELYDTEIKDFRLKSLIVEKRERMLQQHPVPPEYTYVDEYGITRLKPHLFIKEITIKPKFLRQGACRNTEKQIVELSKKEGFEGRVLLESSPIKGTRDYIPNPALAHWANGFRFYSSQSTEQMLDVLNDIRSPYEGPEGCMYYPII